MYVVDVTDKANLKIINDIEWNGPGSPNEIDAVAVSGTGNGEYAYLGTRDQGVIKVSVGGVNQTTPPTEAGRYGAKVVQASGLVLSADESLAFIADQTGGMEIIHTGDMTDTGLGMVKTQTPENGNWSPTNISRDGNTLYLSGSYQGLGIMDVSNPASPSQTYHEVRFGSVTNTVGSGTNIYITRDSLGLETVQLDLTPPAHLVQLAQSLRPAGASSFTDTQGNLTYATSWVGGFRILDTKDPAAPVELSASSLDTSVNNLAVFSPQPGSDTYAYLVTGGPGIEQLRIAKVTDPKNPQYVGQTNSLSGQLNAIGVRQASSGAPVYAYVPASAWWDGKIGQFNNGALHVLDVTNPAAINESVGVTGDIITGNIYAIAFYNKYLIAAESLVYDNKGNAQKGGGLRVFDISNPSAPTQVAYFDGFEAAGLGVMGNRLYITMWGGGLMVWDISDTADPNHWGKIGHYPSVNDAYSMMSVQSIGGRTYVTTGRGSMGMAVLDVTDPSNIQVLDETGRLAGWGWSTSQAGHYALLSSPNSGMYTFWSVPAVEGIIPVAGGALSSAADGTVYTFGSGALERDLRLRHIAVLPANTPPTGKKVGIGHAFVVSATDAANDRPLPALAGSQTYTLEVTYAPAELHGLTETSLALYYWDGSTWVMEATKVDLATHKLTAHPNHFSLWMVLGNFNIFIPVVRK